MANVGDTYEVRIICTLGDQTSINVRHYSVTAKAGTGATDNAIGADMSLHFAASYKDLMANNASFRGVGIRRISPLPVGLELLAGGNTGPGTAGADALPRQCSGILSLRTALAGRSFRGRTYVPFPSKNDNDTAGVPTAGYSVRLGTLAAVMASPVTCGAGGNTNILTAVVYSRVRNQTNPIVTIGTPGKWATIRSRGSYGRVNPSPI